MNIATIFSLHEVKVILVNTSMTKIECWCTDDATQVFKGDLYLNDGELIRVELCEGCLTLLIAKLTALKNTVAIEVDHREVNHITGNLSVTKKSVKYVPVSSNGYRMIP